MKFTRVILKQFANALTNERAKSGAGLQKIRMQWGIKKKVYTSRTTIARLPIHPVVILCAGTAHKRKLLHVNVADWGNGAYAYSYDPWPNELAWVDGICWAALDGSSQPVSNIIAKTFWAIESVQWLSPQFCASRNVQLTCATIQSKVY